MELETRLKNRIELYSKYDNLFFEMYVFEQALNLFLKEGIEVLKEAVAAAIDKADNFMQRSVFSELQKIIENY